MTIPPLDAVYPLQAAPLPEDRLPSTEADPTPLLLALVKQAFSLVRSSDGWKRGKKYGEEDAAKGGSVQYLSCPSDMSGRLKKCAWHARFSQHKPADSGLSFEDMFEGLGTDDHALKEKEYIHDIICVKNVCTVVPGKAHVWHNSCTSHPVPSALQIALYVPGLTRPFTLNSDSPPLRTSLDQSPPDTLPAPTTNRDFVELVVTLPLPPSPAPFSLAHQEVVCQQLASASAGLPDHPGPASAHSRRSFLNISLPVSHSNAPAQPGFVRGMYASVEAIWEGQRHKAVAEAGPGETQLQPDIEWFMAVQSDSGGRIPLFVQEVSRTATAHCRALGADPYRERERRRGSDSLIVPSPPTTLIIQMAMASKISQDVPLFFEWARGRSQESKQSKPEQP